LDVTLSDFNLGRLAGWIIHDAFEFLSSLGREVSDSLSEEKEFRAVWGGLYAFHYAVGR